MGFAEAEAAGRVQQHKVNGVEKACCLATIVMRRSAVRQPCFTLLLYRELYTEKEVIVEERRARYENSPLGRFTGDFLMEVRRLG